MMSLIPKAHITMAAQAIAICVAGQYRTHASTMESLEKHVINASEFDIVDVFYVLGANDSGPLLKNRGVRRVAIDPGRHARSQQFSRFDVCREMMIATGKHYTWAIRTRPDIRFVEDVRLNGLSEEYLHAKLRCANRQVYPLIHLHEIAQELQHAKLKSACSNFVHCGNISTRLDDQFAVVPLKYITAYFASHHLRQWKTNVTLEDKTFPDYRPAVVVYTLTRSLLDQGVQFKPLNLGFCLQRAGPFCRVHGNMLLRCEPKPSQLV